MEAIVSNAVSSPKQVRHFKDTIEAIGNNHMPSRHPFFGRLRDLPPEVGRSPDLLGQIHLIYQSAMHATRAMVYYLPHLDAPKLRSRKLKIFIDDDGLENGDTHHYQLTKVFKNMGAKLLLEDEDFGELDILCDHLDPDTKLFVTTVKTLYPRSLGPWCIVELLSDDWMRALAGALSKTFPSVVEEPYFADCFAHGVEERHAEEALAISGSVLSQRTELLAGTVRDAEMMAWALDGVWNNLARIIESYETCKGAAVRETERPLADQAAATR
jgi:hypothetical protein